MLKLDDDRDMTNPVEMARTAQAKKIEDALSAYDVKVTYAYKELREASAELPEIFEGTTEDLQAVAPFVLSTEALYLVEEYDGINDTDNPIDTYLDDYRWITAQSGDRLCRILAALGQRAEVLISTNTYWMPEHDFLKVWIRVYNR